jgi:hypothetical protein
LSPRVTKSIFRREATSQPGSRKQMNTRPVQYSDSDGRFSLTLPPGWEAERDGEGGLLLYASEGHGLLHLMPFHRESGEEVDPADELYAFLADQDIELEEDEVADVELASGGALAWCEYEADEEDEEVYWLVGVATAPGTLVFASYSCASGEETFEADTVRDILTSLVFEPADPTPPG